MSVFYAAVRDTVKQTSMFIDHHLIRWLLTITSMVIDHHLILKTSMVIDHHLILKTSMVIDHHLILKGKHYYLIPAYDFHETSYATRQLYPWTKIEIKVGSHRPRFHGIRTFWMFLMHFRKPLVADMCFNIYAFYCKNNLNTR